MRVHYEGKRFRNTHDGADAALAEYHQDGDVLWGAFSGGAVRRGALTGLVRADGSLQFTYTMALSDGRLLAGQCRSQPELMADGRIRLREHWQRFGPHAGAGISFLEEVR